MTERSIASRSALPEDQGSVIYVSGEQVALFRDGDAVYGYENACPHKGGPIGEGLVVDGIVTCPWHGSQFEIATGECLRGPSPGPLRPVTLALHDDDVVVDVHP